MTLDVVCLLLGMLGLAWGAWDWLKSKFERSR